MSDAVRVAVIGAGRFGQEHLAAYREMLDVEVVAVVDPDVTRARAGRGSSTAAVFTDVSAMLERASVDLASVAVPADARGRLIDELLDGGVRVLMEKPLARSVEEAKRVIALPGAEHLAVGHLIRYAAPYELIHAVVRRGELGDLVGASTLRVRPASHLQDFPTEDPIWLSMIHDLDALAWVTGSTAAAVTTMADRGSDGRIHRCSAVIDTDSGAQWIAEARWQGDDRTHLDTMQVVGRDGRATLEIGPRDSTVTVVESTERWPGAGDIYTDALRRQLIDVVAAVRAGGPVTRLPPAAAAAAVATAHAISTSLDRDGARIEI